MDNMTNPRPLVSVIIPLYNGARSIGPVLEAVHRSTYEHLEVIVIDDGSTDSGVEIIKELSSRCPYRLISFKENRGVSKARNAGAGGAKGDVLLFIDADCIVQADTIEKCVEELQRDESVCVGGVYTRKPWDDVFFSAFQSLYINYVESKNEHPDYIATHCMSIWKKTFEDFGGFVEDSFIGHQASVEDVEFCHRLLRAGHQLTRKADIQVQHAFWFNFVGSVKNAVKKSKFWTMYSLKNRDVMKDSGAASLQLKVNVFTQMLGLALIAAAVVSRIWWLLIAVPGIYIINIIVNSRFLLLIKKERGFWFLARAVGYYHFVYPFVVAYGSLLGTIKYIWEVKILRRYA